MGRSPGEGNGNPLQYSCLENPMVRGAWQAAVHGVAKSWTQLKWFTAATAAKSLQSCPTLCDPIDGSPPGSPVPGILQARTLEWVAISVSSAWKWKVKVKLLSRVQLLATPWTDSPSGSSVHGIFQARVLEWGAIAFSTHTNNNIHGILNLVYKMYFFVWITLKINAEIPNTSVFAIQFHLYGPCDTVPPWFSCCGSDL